MYSMYCNRQGSGPAQRDRDEVYRVHDFHLARRIRWAFLSASPSLGFSASLRSWLRLRCPRPLRGQSESIRDKSQQPDLEVDTAILEETYEEWHEFATNMKLAALHTGRNLHFLSTCRQLMASTRCVEALM